MFALTLAQIGVDLLVVLFLFSIAQFFVIYFVLTSKNMDFEGLLRVLYPKPISLRDGTVEYRNENGWNLIR